MIVLIECLSRQIKVTNSNDTRWKHENKQATLQYNNTRKCNDNHANAEHMGVYRTVY
jgi:hypothetical protein